MLKTCGFATVAGLLVFGQVAPPEVPVAAWSQASAVGLLMFLLYWILVKQQPKERLEARQHTERVVQQIGADSKAIQKQQHEDQREMIGQIGKLAEHCAHVRNGTAL